VTKAKNYHRLNLRTLAFTVILSLALVLLKTYGWLQTDSLSILTSLLDSSLDVVISLLNACAVLYAIKPADAEHSFGHNSIEDIVGLIQATFIGASGLFILFEAVFRISTPAEILNSALGIKIMILSISTTLLIVLYQSLTYRKTKSIVLQADLLHYLSDFLVNLAIIASLYLHNKYAQLDTIIASVIAFYIISSAIKLGKRAFNNLMDKQLDEADIKMIKKIIKKHKNILGYHDLKTRRSGSKKFIQLHIDLKASLNLEIAHQIADELEKDLMKIALDTEVIVHTDPVK
jgi:ferrous-iron efflux pump FieF